MPVLMQITEKVRITSDAYGFSIQKIKASKDKQRWALIGSYPTLDLAIEALPDKMLLRSPKLFTEAGQVREELEFWRNQVRTAIRMPV